MRINDEFLKCRDAHGSDPLAGLLVTKLGISPLRFALIGVAFALAYMGGLALAFGCFFPREGIVASSSDSFNLLNLFIVFPAIAFYYLWQPAKIIATYAAVLQQLHDYEQAAAELLASIRRAAGQKRWWLAGLVLAIIFMGVGAYDSYFKLGKWWYAANWWMVAAFQLSRGFIAYMIAAIYSRHVAASIRLGRIYEQCEIPSVTLPPSQTRGIRAVAHYAVSFMVFTAVLGLNIGLTPVLSTMPERTYPYLVAVYLIAAPLGFLLPLWGAHRALVARKDRILDALAIQHQAQYDQLLAQVANNDPGTQEGLNRLKAIEAAYVLAKKSWGWPFDTSVLLKAGATVAAPFVVLVSQLLQKLVTELLSVAFTP